MPKLTQGYINKRANKPLELRELFEWDTQTPWFGIRVRSWRRKKRKADRYSEIAYIIKYQKYGRVAWYEKTIGKHPRLSIAEARAIAKEKYAALNYWKL